MATVASKVATASGAAPPPPPSPERAAEEAADSNDARSSAMPEISSVLDWPSTASTAGTASSTCEM